MHRNNETKKVKLIKLCVNGSWTVRPEFAEAGCLSNGDIEGVNKDELEAILEVRDNIPLIDRNPASCQREVEMADIAVGIPVQEEH